MSRVAELLEEACQVEGIAGYSLTAAIVQRKASRPALLEMAKGFRRVAELCEYAAQHIVPPPKETPSSE